jgi:hypothetical protein
LTGVSPAVRLPVNTIAADEVRADVTLYGTALIGVATDVDRGTRVS